MFINICNDRILFYVFLVFFNDGPKIPEEKQNLNQIRGIQRETKEVKYSLKSS